MMYRVLHISLLMSSCLILTACQSNLLSGRLIDQMLGRNRVSPVSICANSYYMSDEAIRAEALSSTLETYQNEGFPPQDEWHSIVMTAGRSIDMQPYNPII